MPITELVFPTFRPETSSQALYTLQTESKTFLGTFGLLSRHVGHIQSANGQDVSKSNRAILALGRSHVSDQVTFIDDRTTEWNDTKNFHNFFPASEVFNAFRTKMSSYLAKPPTPQLIRPSDGYSDSSQFFGRKFTQMFVGNASGMLGGEIEGAWSDLVDLFGKDKRGVHLWEGWGLEGAEGIWVGLLGWDSVEVCLRSEQHICKRLTVSRSLRQ